MSRLKLAKSTVFALCALAFPSVHAQSTGNEADIAQIQKLQGLYVQSIDNADTTLVDQVWSHAPEVIFVEPRGTERGLQGSVANRSGKEPVRRLPCIGQTV